MQEQDDSILFSNYWKPEQETLLPAFRVIFARISGMPPQIPWLLTAALACMGVALFAFGYGRYGWLLLALFVLLMVIQSYLPGKNARKFTAQWATCVGSLDAPYVILYGDHFSFYDLALRHEAEAKYDWITHGMETKRLLILLLKNEKPVFLDKEGFIKGDSRCFQTFIWEKAPHARLFWKKA